MPGSSVLIRYENVLATAARVWKSGDPIGRYQLVLYALSLLCLPGDLLMGWVQRVLLVRDGTPGKPVVFISGYARSGTTLVYQALCRAWDVEYFNNVLVLFSRSYLLANWLFRRVCRRRPESHRNFYGLTKGLSGTNDGAQLFYRWIPETQYVSGEPVCPAQLEEARRFLVTHERWFGKPLLTKNCNNYLVFETYAELLPSARFIFVKRDPVRIVLSTLKAREFVQGSRSVRWEFSLRPRRAGGAAEDPVEEVARNVKHCFDLVDELKAKLGDRLCVIEYEAFCRDPAAVMTDLASRVLGQSTRPEQQDWLKPFPVSDGPVVDHDEMARIQETVTRVMNGG